MAVLVDDCRGLGPFDDGSFVVLVGEQYATTDAASVAEEAMKQDKGKSIISLMKQWLRKKRKSVLLSIFNRFSSIIRNAQ